MLVPNRHGSSEDYRYGFNGKEKDDEIKGEGNSLDFGARMLDTRIGRWFAPDNVIQPHQSPYMFSSDNPIIFIDLDGNTDFWFNGIWVGTDGEENNLIAIVKTEEVSNKIIAKTKMGQDHKIDNPFNGLNSSSYFVIDKDILLESSTVLNEQIKKENLFREHLTVMDDKNGKYEAVERAVGKIADPINDKTADVTSTKRGKIKIHGHPFGEIITKHPTIEGKISVAGFGGADIPSKNDKDDFSKQEMNIIVGPQGSPDIINVEKTIRDERPGSGSSIEAQKIIVQEPLKRAAIIAIYGNDGSLLTTISKGNIDSILKNEKGKLGKNYEKQKAKTNSSN